MQVGLVGQRLEAARCASRIRMHDVGDPRKHTQDEIDSQYTHGNHRHTYIVDLPQAYIATIESEHMYIDIECTLDSLLAPRSGGEKSCVRRLASSLETLQQDRIGVARPPTCNKSPRGTYRSWVTKGVVDSSSHMHRRPGARGSRPILSRPFG